MDPLIKIPSHVRVEIYLARCKTSGKSYVGQTQTHVLNHGKYRLFGYTKRWKAHISEATKDNKDKQCHALNNAIRKYGTNDFDVTLLHTCNMSFGNYFECMYIHEHKSMYPTGYNLTQGGSKHLLTDEARRRISNTVTALWKQPEIVKLYSTAQFKKNDIEKVNKFKDKGVKAIVMKLTYSCNHNNHGIRCLVTDANNKTHKIEFIGKHLKIEDSYKRALAVSTEILADFSKLTIDDKVKDLDKQHFQIAENPLELLIPSHVGDNVQHTRVTTSDMVTTQKIGQPAAKLLPTEMKVQRLDGSGFLDVVQQLQELKV